MEEPLVNISSQQTKSRNNMEAQSLWRLNALAISTVLILNMCVFHQTSHSPMVAFATLPIGKPLVRLNLATTSPTEGQEPVTSVFVMDYFFLLLNSTYHDK